MALRSSSVPTARGSAKAYGVIQGYIEYLERFAKTQKSDDLFPEGGFTNLLFMSPQKSQIDLDSSQKEKILAASGEFICVLSRKDVADLDFMGLGLWSEKPRPLYSVVRRGERQQIYRRRYAFAQLSCLTN